VICWLMSSAPPSAPARLPSRVASVIVMNRPKSSTAPPESAVLYEIVLSVTVPTLSTPPPMAVPAVLLSTWLPVSVAVSSPAVAAPVAGHGVVGGVQDKAGGRDPRRRALRRTEPAWRGRGLASGGRVAVLPAEDPATLVQCHVAGDRARPHDHRAGNVLRAA